MTKEDSYKETKECPCIACGKSVTVTKFASAKKVMCNECKNSGASANPDLVSAATKPQEPRAKYGGETKDCPCIQCGTMVTVTKFASASKVLCSECKGESTSTGGMVDVRIDMSKLDRNVVPPIEEYVATPALVANSALRNIQCPACKFEYMKMIKILDWSDRGLIIHYQCPDCFLLLSVSEQSKQPIGYMNEGTVFDYSGAAIEDLMNGIKSTRANGSIQRLMGILKDHNIEVDGLDLPPYLCENDRPVPIGYRIPRDDPSIKAVDDAIKYLEVSAKELCDDAEIAENADIVKRLKDLFKDGAQS